MDKQRLGVPGSVSWQRKEMKPESDEELRKPDLPLAAYDGGPKPQLHELGPLEDVGCTDIPRDSSFSRVVCCLWLEGKCKRKGWHVNDRKLCLHEDVPGIPCGFGDNCKYHHFKTRTSSLPWADPLSQKPAFQKVLHSRLQEADLPHVASDGGPNSPLHELGGLEGVRCTDIAEDTSISCGSGAHALSTKVSVVCCLWLEGKCWRKGQHVHGKKLFLHKTCLEWRVVLGAFANITISRQGHHLLQIPYHRSPQCRRHCSPDQCRTNLTEIRSQEQRSCMWV